MKFEWTVNDNVKQEVTWLTKVITKKTATDSPIDDDDDDDDNEKKNDQRAESTSDKILILNNWMNGCGVFGWNVLCNDYCSLLNSGGHGDGSN